MMTCSLLLFVSLVSGASIVLFEGLLFVLLFMLGLTLTSATTLAMENAREQAGTASALLGAASFLFGSIVSPLVGMGDILVSTGITFVICAAASCLCGWAAIHGHTPHTAVINNGVC